MTHTKKNILWIVLLTLSSCSNNEVIPATESTGDKETEIEPKVETEKNKYHSIQEVFDSNTSWTNIENQNYSCSLHFNLSTTDTLTIEYSPECYLMFPAKLNGNRISVRMSSIIDSKYDFEIVETIERLNEKYHNQVFMKLTLVNDTTLSSSYTIKEVQKAVNMSDSKRFLFPEKFYHTNRMSMDSYH